MNARSKSEKMTEDDIGSALSDAGFVIVHRQEDKRKVAIEVGRESRDKIWRYRSQLNELLKPFGYAEPWFNIPTFRRRKGMWVSIYVKLLLPQRYAFWRSIYNWLTKGRLTDR